MELLDLKTTKKTKSLESQLKKSPDKLFMKKIKAKKLKEVINNEKNETEKAKLMKRYDKLEQKYKAEFVVYKELENQLAKG